MGELGASTFLLAKITSAQNEENELVGCMTIDQLHIQYSFPRHSHINAPGNNAIHFDWRVQGLRELPTTTEGQLDKLHLPERHGPLLLLIHPQLSVRAVCMTGS